MEVTERTPWRALLAAVVLIPLVVGVIPLSGARLTLNVFVQAKLVALCLTAAVALAGWAFVELRDGTVRTGRALAAPAVLLLVAGLSTLTALDPRLAFFGDSEQGVGLLVLLLCALVGFLASQLVRDGARLRELTSVLVYTATAVAVVGLVQQLFGWDPLGINTPATPEYLIRRGYSTIGNADTYAAFLVLPAVLAFGRLRHAADRRDALVWGACFTALAVTGVASQTRGPFVGVVVALIGYAIAERVLARRAAARGKARGKTSAAPASRRTGLIVLAAVVGGVLIAAFLAQGMEAAVRSDFIARFGSVQALLSLGGRIPLWETALRMTASRPILGVGPDSFRLGWYPLRQVSHLAEGAGLIITDPHNVFLLLAATTGLAGLLAFLLTAGTALVVGWRTAFGGDAEVRAASAADYRAWLFGTVAILVTFLTSLLASVLLLMFFLALGVLIAPALAPMAPSDRSRRTARVVRGASLLVAGVLAVFGLLTAAAQVTAVTARVPDPDVARERIVRAASIAPWDTEIREAEYGATVQAALAHVFQGRADASATVASAQEKLASAAAREPREYVYPYQSAVLLIGAGQKLGDAYALRGLEAAKRGLALYPNSLPLRTGMGSAYLQLNRPADAEAVLRDVWSADPAYVRSGVVYADALVALGRKDQARSVVSLLEERFAGDASVAELKTRVSKE